MSIVKCRAEFCSVTQDILFCELRLWNHFSHTAVKPSDYGFLQPKLQNWYLRWNIMLGRWTVFFKANIHTVNPRPWVYRRVRFPPQFLPPSNRWAHLKDKRRYIAPQRNYHVTQFCWSRFNRWRHKPGQKSTFLQFSGPQVNVLFSLSKGNLSIKIFRERLVRRSNSYNKKCK